MEKEKIFRPEDFDKKPETPKSKYIVKIVVVIAVLVIIGVAVYCGVKGCSSEKQVKSTEQMLMSSEESGIVTDSTSKIVISQHKEETQSIGEASTIDNMAVLEGNKEFKPSTTSGLSDIEKEAFKVIRGEYGNNPIRKNKLGDGYQNIQNRVNELKRQGAF